MRSITTIGLVLAFFLGSPSLVSAQDTEPETTEETEATTDSEAAETAETTETTADLEPIPELDMMWESEATAASPAAKAEEFLTGRFGLGFNLNLGGNAAMNVRYWVNEDFNITGTVGVLVTVDPGPVDVNAGFFLGIGVTLTLISDPGAFYFGVGGAFDLGLRGTGGNTLVEFVVSLPFTLEYFVHPQVSFTLQFGVAMRFGDQGVLIVPGVPGGLGSDFALLLGNRGDVLGSAGFTVYFE